MPFLLRKYRFSTNKGHFLADMPSFMKKTTSRIVGGEDTPSPIPWQVYKGAGCGGTILDPTTILSAAHCTFFIGETIRAGSLKRFSGGQVFCEQDFARNRSQVLFYPRSERLHKSSKIPLQDFNTTFRTVKRIMTMLFSNWTFHSTLTIMSNLHVYHPQRNTLDWIPQKNNASQVDGDVRTQVQS